MSVVLESKLKSCQQMAPQRFKAEMENFFSIELGIWVSKCCFACVRRESEEEKGGKFSNFSSLSINLFPQFFISIF